LSSIYDKEISTRLVFSHENSQMLYRLKLKKFSSLIQKTYSIIVYLIHICMTSLNDQCNQYFAEKPELHNLPHVFCQLIDGLYF